MEKMLKQKNNRKLEVGAQHDLSTDLPSERQLFVYDYSYEDPMSWEYDMVRDYEKYRNEFDRLNKFDIVYLIRTFPEAKHFIADMLQEQINKAQADIFEASRLQPIYEDIVYRKASQKTEEHWRGVVDILFLDPLRVEQTKIIKRNLLYLSMLKGHKGSGNPIGVTEIQIAKAKEYPIDTLIEFKRNVTTCIFHNEKHSSLYLYKKNNTCHCFGACGRSFDTIDIYRKLYNVSFVEAVRKLQ